MGRKPRPSGWEGPLSPGSLKQREWKRFLRGPDPQLLDALYVPALGEAIRYDRCCAYFSSSVLSAAARGFGRLIERLEAMGDAAPRPAVRLVVNEELSEPDARAMMETGNVAALERQLLKRFKNPRDALQKQRLKMLAWLVKRERLDVRVGVMRRGTGVVHAKFGLVTDEQGDSLVFRGSGNESAQGLAGNYEQLEISTSWEDADAHRYYSDEFEALWTNDHPDVYTVPLPEALRLKLIKLAPKEPPIQEPETLARQKAAMIWHFITESPYLPEVGGPTCDATAMVDLWPHQRRVVEETAAAWPSGRLLCDEVGMGKTIEAMMILRRLMAGRGVGRVLILLPAGLMKQWQGELREKGGLLFPRLEGVGLLEWPDGRKQRVSGLAEALEQDTLLLSRETARTEGNLPIVLAAEPWDLVVLDESHAARRRRQEEREFNSGTLLLNLLRELQLRRRTRGFLLLSATPMQTHPWEPWDLLSVLGEGGAWLAEFAGVRDYYGAVAELDRGRCDLDDARGAARQVAADPTFPPLRTKPDLNLRSAEAVAKQIAFVAPSERGEVAAWLRHGSPLARRMHRNTRDTLKAYYERGFLETPPPRRIVEDIRFDFAEEAERRVYNAITSYIEQRFEEIEREKPGKGFVMTIYRRRASSSPQALERSLERRRQALERVARRRALDTYLDLREADIDTRDLDDLGDEEADTRISAGLPTSPKAAKMEIDELDRLLEQLRELRGLDSKRERFYDELRRVSDDGRSVLVFTEYVDTLEYLRDSLVGLYGTELGCYSGAGGSRWDGTQWKTVSKEAITKALSGGELKVLICNDAASEGLNLQAASALINYDLPWNPSKVEQRIGRIDRIGQKEREVRVVNLFLRDSVDDRVYRVLRLRCGLFEHFVGAMQPVLSLARRFLLGRERMDPAAALGQRADQIDREAIASETYLTSEAGEPGRANAALDRKALEAALGCLDGSFGLRATKEKATDAWRLSGEAAIKGRVSADLDALEGDLEIEPLHPASATVGKVAQSLQRSGEHLPLVFGSHATGPFRVSVAVWIAGGKRDEIRSLDRLKKLVEAWDGTYPDPAEWIEAEKAAKAKAARLVRSLRKEADRREQAAVKAQVEAASTRLLRELGRFLACYGDGVDDLNGVCYRLMQREIATRDRLKQALDRLGGYPEWAAELRQEIQEFVQDLSENQRKARRLGSELDAALQDPRWRAI